MSLSKYEEIIKNYLEEECKKDNALKEAYKPEAIKKCFAFIVSKAKKEAVGNCAMVEDVKVFKWARDYYFDELPKSKDKNTEPETKDEDLEEEVTESYESIQKPAKDKKKSAKEKEAELEKAQCLFDFGE